jgi:hypothetical protein
LIAKNLRQSLSNITEADEGEVVLMHFVSPGGRIIKINQELRYGFLECLNSKI